LLQFFISSAAGSLLYYSLLVSGYFKQMEEFVLANVAAYKASHDKGMRDVLDSSAIYLAVFRFNQKALNTLRATLPKAFPASWIATRPNITIIVACVAGMCGDRKTFFGTSESLEQTLAQVQRVIGELTHCDFVMWLVTLLLTIVNDSEKPAVGNEDKDTQGHSSSEPVDAAVSSHDATANRAVSRLSPDEAKVAIRILKAYDIGMAHFQHNYWVRSVHSVSRALLLLLAGAPGSAAAYSTRSLKERRKEYAKNAMREPCPLIDALLAVVGILDLRSKPHQRVEELTQSFRVSIDLVECNELLSFLSTKL
jgi:hypothetical protein